MKTKLILTFYTINSIYIIKCLACLCIDKVNITTKTQTILLLVQHPVAVLKIKGAAPNYSTVSGQLPQFSLKS